ncbi:sialate O-acetylesterase [Niabella terrae]
MKVPVYACRLLALLFICPLFSSAEIQLPWFFSDGMVLQQQSEPAIWGWTDQKAAVTVISSWDHKKYTAQPDQKGRWTVRLKTPPAGGPFEITVSDGSTKQIRDILIGEVWVCSGQSNMEMPLRGFRNQPVDGSNKLILESANDQIRIYTIPRSTRPLPLDTSKNNYWKKAGPETVENFSAVGYYFGKLLYDQLQVPIGLINCSYGGSPVEAFMDAASLQDYDFKLPDPTTTSRLSNQVPTVLYNGMVHPLEGYGIRGCIWYQGESNASRPDQYEKLFPDFVHMLRARFGQGDFPFYYVQIAPYDYNGNKKKGDTLLNSAYLRDAQRKALEKIPNSGMVVTMDIGDDQTIHPRDKKTVAYRLALLALQQTYQMKGFQSESPRFERLEIKDQTALLHFSHAPNGLSAYGQELTGFEIAGADKKFYPARARLVAGGVAVSAAEVPSPVAVRYAFKDYIQGHLFNTAGLPASSFRTDDWEPEIQVK